MLLFEDQVKYDLWVKILLVLSILVLLALGFLFHTDAYSRDVLPGETAKESRIGALVVFAAAIFNALLYWSILPRKIFIYQERIRIKFGLFFYSIPFSTVQSASVTKGIKFGTYISALTSYRNQVEIVRKKGLRVRVSPAHVDQFIEAFNRVLLEWRRIEPQENIH